jgi:hypothetical protein
MMLVAIGQNIHHASAERFKLVLGYITNSGVFTEWWS